MAEEKLDIETVTVKMDKAYYDKLIHKIRKGFVFYVNKEKGTVVCRNRAIPEKPAAKATLQEGDEWDEYTGKLVAYVKYCSSDGIRIVGEADTVYQEAGK